MSSRIQQPDQPSREAQRGLLYLIVFSLREPDSATNVSAYLESISQSHWNAFDHVWFLQSARSATEIRNGLSRLMEPTDQLIVALLAGSAAWSGFDQEAEHWLALHL